jgi:hypothetical protein
MVEALMRRLTFLLLMAWTAFGQVPYAIPGLASGAGSGAGSGTYSLSSGSNPLTETWTVGTGGVTANTLVQTDASAPLKIVAATTGSYGVAMSTVSAAGSVEVARLGTINCVTDTGGSTAGDLVILGTGSAIDCRDSGQTASSAISIATRIIGVFRSTVTAGNPALVELTPAHFGTGVLKEIAWVQCAATNCLAGDTITTPRNISAATAGTLQKCSVRFGTAPSASTVIEIHKNGSGTALATITASAATASTTSFTSATLAESDYLIPLIPSVGATPGKDANVICTVMAAQ